MRSSANEKEALKWGLTNKRKAGENCVLVPNVPTFHLPYSPSEKGGEESGQQWGRSESIEWFIEDQAFLQSNDSGPGPPPSRPPLPSASCLSFSVLLCVAVAD
jgi:hypothetical protein